MTEYKIELRRCNDKWRWQRSDGEWVSPEFVTLEAAHYFVEVMPFLTDEEWKSHYPLPQLVGEKYRMTTI